MKHDPIIYFIQNIETKNIKIGSTCNFVQRLSQLIFQINYEDFEDPYDTDGKFEECKLHDQFNHLKIRGEWFQYKNELENFIEKSIKEK